MLRKTYRIMQKTKTAVQETGDDLFRFAARPLKGLAGQINTPLAFTACPPDIWPGVADQGQDFIRFINQLDNQQLDLVVSPHGLDQIDLSFHRFNWLHDLRTLGHDLARRTAARVLTTWSAVNRDPTAILHTPEITATRLFNLIGAYGFYGPALSDEETCQILQTLKHHLEYLKRTLTQSPDPSDGFFISAALLAGSIALSFDPGTQNRSLYTFEKYLGLVLLADGGPQSRRPGDLPALLATLINLRHLMMGVAIPLPATIAHAIDRTVPGLRFFRFDDGGLATFHGTGTGDRDTIDKVSKLAHLNSRAPNSLPYTGFERLQNGSTTLIMDSGVSGPAHHASTTAFEMTVGTQRLIVSCGQHRSNPNWQDLLSASSAHSTLILDHADNKPARGMATVETIRHHHHPGQAADVKHQGYATRNGFIHRRRLFLSNDGLDARGQDDLNVNIPPVMPMPYCIRFHLHPDVNVAALQSGTECLLKLKDGQVWRFVHDGEQMTVEDSVYLGETGLPQKTRQIVVAGQVFGAQKTIRWALRSSELSTTK